jgi:non-specific serine/threonine protein kinase
MNVYRLGRVEVRPSERVVTVDGRLAPLGSRAFDILLALIDHRDRVVTKDELLERCWAGLVVEEHNLHTQVSQLRKVLGSDVITTVPGRGYQLTLPVLGDDGRESPAASNRHNLQNSLTSFIGREQELAQLAVLVASNRLVTLTGTGGIGKTRLAAQVARRLLGTFRDGVWLVELAALSDSRLVPQAVALALGVREEPMRPVIETLSENLSSKKLLLLLDNAEHLLEGCIQLVDRVLRRSSDISFLVTSRERLGVMGELTFGVPSLTVPEASEAHSPETVSACEAVRLFVERAGLVRAGFEMTARNAPQIGSICARLDGMPLAVELAAARVRAMSVDELGERLDQRFALLTDGSRAALPRHRTLRSVLDWSYDLLSGRDQAMLRRVAVFAGGWTLANAELICAGDGIEAANVLERLTSLIDKSLIVTDEQGGVTRYRMLETVRQYACDRLCERGEEARWRSSHLVAYAALAEEFFKQMLGPNQQSELSRIASEHDNLRGALAWAAESRPVEGLRLAGRLNYFWLIGGHLSEGREWLARLLAAFPIDGPKSALAHGLYSAGLLATPQGDYDTGTRLLEESLALYRELDDAVYASNVLDALINLLNERGDFPGAEVLAREAVEYAQASGNRSNLFSSLANLAIALYRQGQHAAARELYERALVAARELGWPWHIALTLNEMGRAECDEGHFDVAQEHFSEALTILRSLGDRVSIFDSLEGFAGIAAGTAAPRRAVHLWGAASVFRKNFGSPRSLHLRIDYERQVEAVRTAWHAEAFDQAWDEGSRMPLEDAVRYALDENAHPANPSRSPPT